MVDLETPMHGGRRSQWMRSWKVWELHRDYFPIQLVKTAELPPTRNYVLGSHPHGIICAGAFSAFCTEACGFSRTFPGLTSSLALLAGLFYVPVYREYMMSSGGEPPFLPCLVSGHPSFAPRRPGAPPVRHSEAWEGFFGGVAAAVTLSLECLGPSNPLPLGPSCPGLAGKGISSVGGEGRQRAEEAPDALRGQAGRGVRPPGEGALGLCNAVASPLPPPCPTPGMVPVSKRSLDFLLRAGPGRAVVIVVGGAMESLDCNPGEQRVHLSGRRGFVRLALEHG
uniref:Acyltransferase n=1 Tax=Pseudonaja textilis TaxID=8673 RepID=A0A670ZL78_PSETE